MNFFQRALKNITRKKTKSVLLLLTFFLIGNFVIIGIGISTAASQAKILTRQSMRAVVEYQIDYDALYEYTDSLSESELEEFYNGEEYRNITQLKPEEYLKFLDDERVATLNCSSYNTIVANIEPVKLNNDYEQNNSGISSYYSMDADGNSVEVTYQEPNFKVVTNRVPNMIELYEGTWTITEGRFYTQEEIDSGAPVALINDQVAELNGISIGDSITLDFSSNYAYMQSEGFDTSTVELKPEVEIIGFYSTTETVDPASEDFKWMATYQSPFNKILMPITSLAQLQLPMSQASYDFYATVYPDEPYYSDPANRPTRESLEYVSSIVFLLKDPLDVDQFVLDYEAETSQEYRMFNANNDTFKTMARPLDSIGLYANVIVAIVVVNAIVIITLVTALTLKTREYEIGVLLSIGANKTKVVLQMFTELLLVALLGFTLSAVSGSLIASSAGQAILSYQVAVDDSYASDDDTIYYYGDQTYFTEVNQADLLENYQVSISPVIIAEIYVAGIGIVLVSILVPSLMIMRFNPKKILTSSL